MSVTLPKMKVLLLGVGPIAEEYCKVLLHFQCEIWVVGRSEINCKLFSNKFSVKTFPGTLKNNLNELIGVDFHLCIAAIPVDEIYNNIISALNALTVKNYLVEKPVSVNFKEISDLCSYTKSSIYVAYNRRQFSSTNKLIELLKDNRILSVHFEFTEWIDSIDKNSKFDQDIKSNWLLANSTHVIDLFIYLCGYPKQFLLINSRQIEWHSSPTIYIGSGVTEKNIFFTYNSNWISGGRWKLEVCNSIGKYILCPLEGLSFMARNSVEIENVTLENELDIRFKPGFFKQIEKLLNNDYNGLCSIDEHKLNFSFYQLVKE